MRRISSEVYKKLGNWIPEEPKEPHHVAPMLVVIMPLHNGGGGHHHGRHARAAPDPRPNLPPGHHSCCHAHTTSTGRACQETSPQPLRAIPSNKRIMNILCTCLNNTKTDWGKIRTAPHYFVSVLGQMSQGYSTPILVRNWASSLRWRSRTTLWSLVSHSKHPKQDQPSFTGSGKNLASRSPHFWQH